MPKLDPKDAQMPVVHPVRRQLVIVTVQGLPPGLLCQKPPEPLGAASTLANSCYLLINVKGAPAERDGCVYGFPEQAWISGLQATAGTLVKGGLSKKLMASAVRLAGEPDGLTPLITPGPVAKVRQVRAGSSGRAGALLTLEGACFPQWQARIGLKLDERFAQGSSPYGSKGSYQSLVDLFTAFGDGIGIGAWRPGSKCAGAYGCFEVTGFEMLP